MPTGKPKRGFRISKKQDPKSIEEVERRLISRYPSFLDQIEALTKPIQCPNCGEVIKAPDRDALIYLCDRVAGKPKQKTELDITQTFVLNADQIDSVLKNNLPQIVQIYENEIKALLEPKLIEAKES